LGDSIIPSIISKPKPKGLPPLDPNKYEMYGPFITHGSQTVQHITSEEDKYVYMIEQHPYTKIVKAPPTGSPQEGFYYVGGISDYGKKSLTKQTAGKYNVRNK
jgi:hypothetical protein